LVIAPTGKREKEMPGGAVRRFFINFPAVCGKRKRFFWMFARNRRFFHRCVGQIKFGEPNFLTMARKGRFGARESAARPSGRRPMNAAPARVRPQPPVDPARCRRPIELTIEYKGTFNSLPCARAAARPKGAEGSATIINQSPADHAALSEALRPMPRSIGWTTV